MWKYHRTFYCLNCLQSFPTEKKCESHKTVFQNKDFCNNMFSEGTKILECNKYQKFDNRKDWWT